MAYMKDSTGRRLDSFEVSDFSQRSVDKLDSQRRLRLLPWFSAYANRRYAPINVVALGDSITEGGSVTTWTRRWVNLLGDELRGGAKGGVGFIPADWEGPPNFTPPAVINASNGVVSTFGPTRRALTFTNSTHKVTYTINGTDADIYHIPAVGRGSFNYILDGAAPVVVASTSGDGREKAHRISLGSSGPHTLVVGWDSVGTVYHTGVDIFDGDTLSGVRVHGLGRWGTTSANWVSGTYNTSTNWPYGISRLKPDLFLLNIGVNDFSNGLTPAQWKTNVLKLINDLRAPLAVGIRPPVVISMYFERSDQANIVAPWQDFITAALEIEAADTEVVVLDHTLKMPKVGTINATGLFVDNVHPSDRGHQMLADTFASFLKP
jgi:lysophospholipase L1-like esterase